MSNSDKSFTVASYLKSNLPNILICIFCLCGIALLASVQGIVVSGVILICVFCIICIIAAFTLSYMRKRTFYGDMEGSTGTFDDACDFASSTDEPAFIEGQVSYKALISTIDAAQAQIEELERNTAEYREYIEAWIHETKTPIAAARLVSSNIGEPNRRNMIRELDRIDAQVEQALYYARSSSVQNDYLIRKVPLGDICRDVCKQNSRFLIENGCTPAFMLDDGMSVLADSQWLSFILAQIIRNSAQYGASKIEFKAYEADMDTPRERTILSIKDDGVGIAFADLPRIFERGFTGLNGRSDKRATGLGLYLVAKLAQTLGYGVEVESAPGEGCEMRLVFPHDMQRLSYIANA